MIIIITAQDANLNNYVDVRFGRARGFLKYDTESKEITFHDNSQNLNAVQGAGIQTAQNIQELGASAVLTGHCGPKAFRVLSLSGIKVFTGFKNKTCAEALNDYLKGDLIEANNADVEGHWA